MKTRKALGAAGMGALALVLAGTGFTAARWYETEDLTPAVIASGDLDLDVLQGEWQGEDCDGAFPADPETWLMVPGEIQRGSFAVDLAGSGTHLTTALTAELVSEAEGSDDIEWTWTVLSADGATELATVTEEGIELIDGDAYTVPTELDGEADLLIEVTAEHVGEHHQANETSTAPQLRVGFEQGEEHQ